MRSHATLFKISIFSQHTWFLQVFQSQLNGTVSLTHLCFSSNIPCISFIYVYLLMNPWHLELYLAHRKISVSSSYSYFMLIILTTTTLGGGCDQSLPGMEWKVSRGSNFLSLEVIKPKLDKYSKGKLHISLIHLILTRPGTTAGLFIYEIYISTHLFLSWLFFPASPYLS